MLWLFNILNLFFSVADPEWFISDPDPALNFPISGSRRKFRIRIQAKVPDPNPTYIYYVYLEIIKNHLKLNKFNQKEEI